MKTIVSIAIFPLIILCATAVFGRDIRTVALTGRLAPDTSGGEVLSSFESPVLNSSGQTAFYGVLAGNTVDGSNDLGIWSEGVDVLGLVARTGSQAPGTPAGVNFGTFDTFNSGAYLLLNDAGQIAFTASLIGESVSSENSVGIWSGEMNSLRLIARDGDHAPGTPGEVIFGRVGGKFRPSLALNGNGQVAFKATLTGPGVTQRERDRGAGIWSSSNDVPTIVVRSDDQAPGFPAGVRFRALFQGPTIDRQGRTAFFANLAEGSFDRAIWSERSGSLAPIAREGDNAPETAEGVVFETFFTVTPSLNSSGQAAFYARVRGTGVTTNNDYGVWSEDSGAFRLLARDGESAPGLDEQEVFFSDIGNPFSRPNINSAGDIAFSGSTRLSNGSPIRSNGIWVERSGSLDLVISSRMAIPGIAGEVRFRDRALGAPALNAAGQVAFSSLLTGEGINDGNDKGIWAENRQRELFLIVREGELLEVEPGDFRTIESLSFLGGTGNDNGLQSAFNDRGQLAFQARFTDGTEGIFVSNLVAVPEPSTLFLILSGMVFSVLSTAADRRTRRRT